MYCFLFIVIISYNKNIYNRNGLLKQSEILLKNYKNKLFVCLNLDIDDFKLINNLFGYDYGNMVLNDLAIELKSVFDKNSIISKTSVDEFTLLLFYEDIHLVIDRIKLFITISLAARCGTFSDGNDR